MANKINIENYEAFLLDYMEGNLSTEGLVALQIFAAQHPHLNIDLNDLELVELNTEEVKFENKENLKKALVSDEQFVAYIENGLSTKEKQNIDALCASHPTLANELKLYKKSFVIADDTIVFENKAQLKKQDTKVLWLFSREVLAAAASLILIAGLWFMFKDFSAFDSGLSSEKIKGNSAINLVALKNNSGSVSSYTVEKTNNASVNNNPVAYSNTVEIAPQNDNTPLITNNTPKENKDNAPKEIIAPKDKENDKIDEVPVKIASTNNSNSKQYIITEKAFDEDEKQIVASNTKKGFWSRAKDALNGLNKLGVKKAKGTETVESNNEQHVLTLGNFKVENHKFNAE